MKGIPSSLSSITRASRPAFFHLLLLLLLLLPSLNFTLAASPHRKVLLKDIQAITLHAGQMTAYRRTYAVPQLSCISSSSSRSACDDTSMLPQTVQCINKGTDGIDVQWACTADMDNTIKLGPQLTVACEGWAYPDDPYVLAGSCGLEYSLVRTTLGDQIRESKAEHQQYNKRWNTWSFWSSDEPSSSWYRSASDGDQSRQKSQSSGKAHFGWISTAVWTIVFAAIAYRLSLVCWPRRDRTRPQNGSNGQHRPTGTYHSGNTNGASFDSNAGPPPPYNTAWESQTNTGTHANSDAPGSHPGCYPNSDNTRSSSSNGSSNSGTGFWSGFTTGGILGTLFGSNSYDAHPPYVSSPYSSSSSRWGSWWGSSWRRPSYYSSYPSTTWFSPGAESSLFTRSRSHSRPSPPAPTPTSSTHTSTSYGGTRRR
ncbi:hypothetical protein BASA61_003472 [Batrachochytrium salamandrivorans]|nr:hypothetical protein BASA61_003472 [Batrachochytrium salamandrivorans]KAH9268511.1 hypothetical protein BASA83_009356 [Batrachochytrium salamandrivorans]